jgi:uncharacterized peroxidase-related enzyme
MLFPSLPADASVRDALRINPEAGRLLAAYHQQVLRGPSPLTVAERELIAAFVSGLNQCSFCHGTHLATATLLGVPETMVGALIADPGGGDAPPRLRPLLAFARKLTRDQGRIDAADAEAIYAAGWDERALHDLILIVATFNFMNRFVHGHGIEGDEALWADRGRYLFEHGYSGVVEAEPSGPPAAVGTA